MGSACDRPVRLAPGPGALVHGALRGARTDRRRSAGGSRRASPTVIGHRRDRLLGRDRARLAGEAARGGRRRAGHVARHYPGNACSAVPLRHRQGRRRARAARLARRADRRRALGREHRHDEPRRPARRQEAIVLFGAEHTSRSAPACSTTPKRSAARWSRPTSSSRRAGSTTGWGVTAATWSSSTSTCSRRCATSSACSPGWTASTSRPRS